MLANSSRRARSDASLKKVVLLTRFPLGMLSPFCQVISVIPPCQKLLVRSVPFLYLLVVRGVVAHGCAGDAYEERGGSLGQGDNELLLLLLYLLQMT